MTDKKPNPVLLINAGTISGKDIILTLSLISFLNGNENILTDWLVRNVTSCPRDANSLASIKLRPKPSLSIIE